MTVTCALCARAADAEREGDPPLGWSTEPIAARGSQTADARSTTGERIRWTCTDCTRAHVRAIEAKLDPEWW